MVTINGEKMSKSIGNIRSIKHVLENWGPNIIRLFCLSGHYSKPIDYSEELLNENLIKWRQAEAAYYELIHADGSNSQGIEWLQKISEEFDNALEDDLNTHLATTAFFQLVKEINRVSVENIFGKEESELIKKEFSRMMKILGLIIPEISIDEKQEIDKMIADREIFRKEKQFEKADQIRDKLNEMNVILVDHKKRTVWMKKEKIKFDN